MSLESLQNENADLQAESETFQANAEKLIILTQQLTDKNVKLEAQVVDLRSKVHYIRFINYIRFICMYFSD